MQSQSAHARRCAAPLELRTMLMHMRVQERTTTRPMAATAVLSVVALLCATTVNGGVPQPPIVPAQGYEGEYPGRFGPGIAVQAVFNQGGVVGNVVFSQEQLGEPVQIHVNLVGLDQYRDQYPWSINEYQVSSSLLADFPCSESQIGGIFNPENVNETCDDTSCRAGDLAPRIGTLRYDTTWQIFEDSTISLFDSDSIVGRSLVIDREGGATGNFICANIEPLGVRKDVLRAAFDNPVLQGDVIIQYLNGLDDAIIKVDLFSNIDETFTQFSLFYGVSGTENACDVDVLVGSETYEEDDFNCGLDTQRECRLGDLTSKCGSLEYVNGRARIFCTDNQLGSNPLSYIYDRRYPERALTVVLTSSNGSMLCAQLELSEPLQGQAQFRTNTIFGDFLFWQVSPDDRTYVRTYLTGLRGVDYSLRVYTNEIGLGDTCDDETLGDVFSKPGGEFVIPGDTLTNDAGSVGNLDSLLPLEDGQESLRVTEASSFLPLFGPYSILDRTLALVNEETGEIVACGPIVRQAEYPVAELASLSGYQNVNNPPLPDPFEGIH